MLGTYRVVVSERPFGAQTNADLDRYLRMEYGGTMTVAAFLSEAGAARKARKNGLPSFARGIRTLVYAVRRIATRHRSKVPTAEG